MIQDTKDYETQNSDKVTVQDWLSFLAEKSSPWRVITLMISVFSVFVLPLVLGYPNIFRPSTMWEHVGLFALFIVVIMTVGALFVVPWSTLYASVLREYLLLAYVSSRQTAQLWEKKPFGPSSKYLDELRRIKEEHRSCRAKKRERNT